jgi:hypothetical protein
MTSQWGYRVGAVTTALAVIAPTVALGAPLARMGAKLQPERLGAPTAVSLSLVLPTSEDKPPPPPLIGIDIRYPSSLGLATSDLGLAPCSPLLLEAEGPSVCPANSWMGSGNATVAVPIGGESREERVGLALVAGPSPDGYVHLLVAATGRYPVSATIVMTAVLRAGQLRITIPPVPSLPGEPDVSLVRMRLTIGGNFTYYEHARGTTVAFKPRGIALPRGCPQGGFRFDGALRFADGSHSSTRAAVACPSHRR